MGVDGRWHGRGRGVCYSGAVIAIRVMGVKGTWVWWEYVDATEVCTLCSTKWRTKKWVLMNGCERK